MVVLVWWLFYIGIFGLGFIVGRVLQSRNTKMIARRLADLEDQIVAQMVENVKLQHEIVTLLEED